MKILFLYTIPIFWVIAGLLYLRSLPKNGFSGVGEAFFILLVGIVLLIGVVVFHIRKVVNAHKNLKAKVTNDKV